MNDRTAEDEALQNEVQSLRQENRMLRRVLQHASYHLKSYRAYSDEMSKIGRGHEPSSEFRPEYLAAMIAKATA